MKEAARYWLLAAAWNGVVLLASFAAFSAANTGSILATILTALFGRVDPRLFLELHFLIRKAAHFTEYGILSLLWFRACRGPRSGHRWSWSWTAIAIALLTAIVDEFHQSLVPGRTPSPYDVLLDLAGAITVQVLVWAAWSRKEVEPS